MKDAVWYIPGYLHKTLSKTKKELRDKVQSAFCDCNVVFKTWKDNILWPIAVMNADTESKALALQILALSEAERKHLILVGHSLGGRIVVRTLAELARVGAKIKHGIPFGAAISNEDEDLRLMGSASIDPVWVVCNPHDNMLRRCYDSVEILGKALGTNGVKRAYANCKEFVVPDNIAQVAETNSPFTHISDGLNEIGNHYAEFYLDFIGKIRDGGQSSPSCGDHRQILVLQGEQNLEIPVANGEVWWNTLEKCKGWQLQKHILTGHARIIDPDNIRKAWGNLATMRRSFRKVRQQLQ